MKTISIELPVNNVEKEIADMYFAEIKSGRVTIKGVR